MKTIILLLLLLLPASTQAQEYLLERFGIEEVTPEMQALLSAFLKHRFEITGKVMGTDDYEPIPYPLQNANIQAYCVADTTQMGGAAVGNDGTFTAYIFCRNKLKDLRVHIMISYVGMEPFEGVFTPTPGKDRIGDKLVVNLDSIVLRSSPVTIAEAEIIGELQKMYQRGDTTIFNAEAYEMPSGSVLLDLVRRLPGLRYEGGQLTYMGESIQEMRLNGDSFFKHDINVALQNMPHDKLKSLKVYEVPDDTLDVNSDEHLVMDMQTKTPVNNVQFANIAGGISETLKNFQLSASGNYYVKGGAQMGLNFSTRDLPSQNTPTLRSVNTNVALSYEQQLGKTHVDARLNHGYNRTDSETKSFTQLYMPGYSQRTTTHSTNSQKGHNYEGTARLSGVIDSLTRWNSNLTFTSNDSHNLNAYENIITDDNNAHISTTIHSSLTNANSKNIGWNGNLNRYLDSEQHNEVGLRAHASINNNRSTTFNTTQSVFTQMGNISQTTNHTISRPSDNLTLSGSLFYNHSFSKKNTLQVSYTTNYTTYDNDELYNQPTTAATTGNLLALIDSLSYNHHYHTLTHTLSSSLLIDNSLLNMRLAMRISPTRQVIEDKRLDQTSSHTSYSTTIFAPSAQLRFKINEGQSSIQLRYNGSNSMPGVRSLSATTDYSDPMNIFTGNCHLKEAFSHNAGIEIKYKTLLRATVDYGCTENQVTLITRLDPTTGIRHTSPQNINGNWDIRSYLFLTKQVNQVSFNLIALHSHSNNVSYVQTVNTTDITRSTTRWDNYNLMFISGYTDANWIAGGTLIYNIDHRKNEYVSQSTNGKSLASQLRLNYTTSDGSWAFGTDFNLQKRFDYELASANTTDIYWSLNAQHKFLRSKRATVALTWNDILNRNRGFSASMSDTQWSETHTLGKTSYLLLSLSYRFSLLK